MARKLTKDHVAIIIGIAMGIVATVTILMVYRENKIDTYPTSQITVKG